MASSLSVPDVRPAARGTWLVRHGFPAAVALAIAATLGLHAVSVLRPMLLFDDFEILSASWTWQQTVDNLWHSANEHAMPLGRLSTWLLIQLAGGATRLPLVAALQGPLAVVLGMVLVYRFNRRELGHPLYGLLAMTFFGVTSQYTQAVSWFAASFAVLALDTVLLALLAAQRWRQTGAWRQLAVCAIWSALAPCWFASGILAGPLCVVYLLPPGSDAATEHLRRLAATRPRLGSWLAVALRLGTAALPLLGSAAFLAVSLPRTAERIIHLEQWGDKTADQSIHFGCGLVNSFRSTVDNLLLGTFGVSGVNCPPLLVPVVLLFLAVAAVVWWRLAPNRRLLALGLAFIASSYVLIYSARARWPYEQISVWSRYQLFSHMGLVLFLSGGLPRWQGWFLQQDWTAPAARRRIWIASLVVTLYFIAQLPRSVANAYYYYDAQQMRDLEYIEAVDAVCREHRIGADSARAALNRLGLPKLAVKTAGRFNGWDFLRGSSDPLPVSVAEAERALADLAGTRKAAVPE